ncbi:GntR family transcriptional regulator [Bosea rubneri]|uniref:GntR family transcriptional regulator n=1 Tax=Bosea rubneri TaxID=3075434 RepID=A0ABU3SGB1_9HYPH|nr:GntR family transcriptional regulator [Bosea sp. ZW T0_25]MDU0343839.1 GntR family transcriptional regulator [Bosea sp. ZW T0_25]
MNQSEQAVGVIEHLIEQGDLKPGSMVSERGLMELTGLGRTPVREAIQRLALNHMLRIHPNKGIEIPAISVEDQLSGLEVRRAVEVLAVELACSRATEKDIGAIAALKATLAGDFALPNYSETVRQTHALIIQAAHNPYLEALMVPLQTLSRRFWIMHVRDEQVEIAHGKRLHQDILQAILARDTAQAGAASLALNAYLVEFALSVVARMASTRS